MSRHLLCNSQWWKRREVPPSQDRGLEDRNGCQQGRVGCGGYWEGVAVVVVVVLEQGIMGRNQSLGNRLSTFSAAFLRAKLLSCPGTAQGSC